MGRGPAGGGGRRELHKWPPVRKQLLGILLWKVVNSREGASPCWWLHNTSTFTRISVPISSFTPLLSLLAPVGLLTVPEASQARCGLWVLHWLFLLHGLLFLPRLLQASPHSRNIPTEMSGSCNTQALLSSPFLPFCFLSTAQYLTGNIFQLFVCSVPTVPHPT